MSSPESPSSDSVSDSGHSSPSSSTADSPRVNFGSSDPLTFLLKPDTTPRRSGSSIDDSLFSSATSSTHDSPPSDWSASATLSSKDTSESFWHQPDLSLFSLDNFNPSGTMDFSLGFDSMLFQNDALFASPTAGISNPPSDLYSFSFNCGPETVQHTPTSGIDDRRSSITTSSSSVSLSPVTEHVQAASSVPHSATPALGSALSQGQASDDQLVDELAARARQLVGLTMALPFSEGPAAPQRKQNEEQTGSFAPPVSGHLPPSVPSASSPTSPSSSATTPAPTTTRTKTSHTTIERRYRTNLNARIQSLRAAVPALRVLEVKHGNRVGNLSLKAGTRRVGVDPDAQPGQEDVIDERGYIDGVKVARKGSKANVLGKAVEYIHVLKRREMRLKREQDGLKALIRSLVGGPELVQQWEKMWRERFGGPEKDEINGDDAEADDENDDGEDDDEADDREADEASTTSGRKRKRARVDPSSSVKAGGTKIAGSEGFNYSQAAQPIPIMPSRAFSGSVNALSISPPVQPEKRKRGRPRKVPLPPVVAPTNTPQTPFATQYLQQDRAAYMPTSSEVRMGVDPTAIVQGKLQPSPQSRTPPGQQYLLAAFAFFSFFNSPLSHPFASTWATPGHAAHHHSYAGSVLVGTQPEDSPVGWETTGTTGVFSWRDAVQITHLTLSLLLLLSIIVPWFPGLASRIPQLFKPALGVTIDVDTAQTSPSVSQDQYSNEEEKADAASRMELLSALSRGSTLPPQMEADVLREALCLRTGVWGLVLSLIRQLSSPSRSRSRYGSERRMLEQKAFLRFVELVAMDAHASITTRIQAYLYSFKFLSAFSASAKDISTLALITRPIWQAKSASLWALARSRAQGKIASAPHVSQPYEAYILETMSVDKAAAKLAALGRAAAIVSSIEGTGSRDSEDDVHLAGPLAVLAKHAIRDFVCRYAEQVFLHAVSGDEGRPDIQGDGSDDKDVLEREFSQVVDAGRSLDTPTAKLSIAFHQVCRLRSAPSGIDLDLDSDSLELDSAGPSGDLASSDTEIFALLYAIILYRRIFPRPDTDGDLNAQCLVIPDVSASLMPMPSPPPSPSRRDAVLHLALRRCLDSPAFDRGDSLEDARDRVVDMLTAESIGWPKRLKP